MGTSKNRQTDRDLIGVGRRSGVPSIGEAPVVVSASLDGESDSTGPLATLGGYIYRHCRLVLVAALVFVLASGAIGIGVLTSLKAGGFFDPNAESTSAARVLHEQLGRDQGTLLVLFTGQDGTTVDRPEYRVAVDAVLAKLKSRAAVGQIYTYFNTGQEQLVSADRRSTVALVGLNGDDDAQVKSVAAFRPILASDHLQVRLGGRPAIYEELVSQTRLDLEKAELLSFPIVALLLLLIFRSVTATLLPLVIGITSVLGAFAILQLLTRFTDVSIFSINIITLLGFGLAIDYSLFIVSRFREELDGRGGGVQAAITATLRTAGHTVFFSGITVAVCLLGLLVFTPMFIRSLGFGAAVAVLIDMLAALTILPAILSVLGSRISSLSLLPAVPRRRDRARDDAGFWYRTSQVVMRYPVAVLMIVLVPLIWIGLPILRINFSVFDARSLPASHESRTVSDVLAQQFPHDDTQPIELVVRTTREALDPASLGALYDYAQALAALPGVRRVDSLVTVDPRRDKAAYLAYYSAPSRARDPRAAGLARQFANGHYIVISVDYAGGDPYAPANRALVGDIRALAVPSGLDVEVGGESAYLVDFLGSLGRSAPLALGVVVGAMVALMFLMLGSLLIPIKAVALSILSMAFSFGTLVWIFQDGHLSGLLGFTPTGSIDSSTPVVVFATVFGLSMDYEVFLLSRVREYYRQSGDTRTAVAVGLQKTGGIITSAALLLTTVTATFSTGEVLSVKQIGVCLGLAILVDATVVRTLLVPATMRLLGKYNWWAPTALTTWRSRWG